MYYDSRTKVHFLVTKNILLQDIFLPNNKRVKLIMGKYKCITHLIESNQVRGLLFKHTKLDYTLCFIVHYNRSQVNNNNLVRLCYFLWLLVKET